MLSSSVDVYYDGQTYVPEESTQNNNNLGLILGLTIGGVVLIIIIIVVVYKCKKSSEDIKIEDSSDIQINKNNIGDMNNMGDMNDKALYN